LRQHDAVFQPQAQAGQRIGRAVGAFCQLAVGDAAGIVDESGLARAPGAKIRRSLKTLKSSLENRGLPARN